MVVDVPELTVRFWAPSTVPLNPMGELFDTMLTGPFVRTTGPPKVSPS